MTTKEYYTPPQQEIFDEIKSNAIKIWETYNKPDDTDYRTEKINAIKDLENIQDNAWYIMAMFDPSNQRLLISMCNKETQTKIKDAMGYNINF